jgi:hypothetical protein
MAVRTEFEAKPKPDVTTCGLNPPPQRASQALAGRVILELTDPDAAAKII